MLNKHIPYLHDKDCCDPPNIVLTFKTLSYKIYIRTPLDEIIMELLKKTVFFSISHPLQVIFIHYKSRIATAIRGV